MCERGFQMPGKQMRVSFGAPELEGVVTLPPGDDRVRSGRAGVILAHPHSKLGGNLHAEVLVALTQRLSQEGYVVLRFNFRGVGRSKGGASWTGKAERKDVESAAAFMRKLLADPSTSGVSDDEEGNSSISSDAAIADEASVQIAAGSADAAQGGAGRLYFVGYSFGSAVGLGCAELFDGCVALSYPYGRVAGCALGSHYSRAGNAPQVPKLFVVGDADQFAGVSALRTFVDALPGENNSFELLPNADHFWNGQEHELFAPVVGFLASL